MLGEVSAIDAAGAHVYFAANGVLTSTPNAQGEHAVPGLQQRRRSDCNLYEYDTGAHQISLVAVLSSSGRAGLDCTGDLGRPDRAQLARTGATSRSCRSAA